MLTNQVAVKPDTRNHRGCFVQEANYKFMGIDRSGWALICIDDASCHYVDPDSLQDLGEQINDLI